ncbi:MAG: peptidoglycan-binding protein [Goleter apudmare HA4340-LM2]|jgi:murein L,D-transpeptidase YcbB/YkuD|nr:peptidoglycan-binding protein [Goleter apudmare HA4340-LM2]
MSEIGLLVTGVLKSGQPSVPNFLEQQPFHSENGVQASIRNQLSRLVVNAQITPPEFIQTDRSSPIASSALQLKNANTLNKIGKKLAPLSPPKLLAQVNYSGESVLAAKSRGVGTRLPKFSGRRLPIVSFGNSGVTVRVLQRLLISNGYGMRVDGVFGPLTETAVKSFQNRRSLTPDGIVGQKTWRALTI